MATQNLQSDRDRVLEATDLVALVGEHVALRPKGREHVGLCPFHDDRTPSLAIVTHKGGAFYKCFACGAAGNAIDFVMNFHKLPFGEALKHLATRAHIELQPWRDGKSSRDEGGVGKGDLLRANAIALRFFRRMLSDANEGAIAQETIASRRIAPAMVEAFQLGYAPDRRDAMRDALKRLETHAKQNASSARESLPSFEAFITAGLVRETKNGLNDLLRHRIVFPIFDELGRPIAFGGRKIRDEDEPKYINSPETPLFHKSKSLYGIHVAKQAIIKSRVAVVTEGYTDVIACHEAGFTNVVATLGTALTVEHARLLRRLCDTVILLFDGDAAGMKAADRGVEVFFHEPIDVKVCTLPNGLDPDELLREANGAETFRAALDGAVDALGYLVNRFRAEYQSRAGLSGRQQSLEALLRRLVDLGFGALSGVRRRFVLASLADLTGVSEREIEAAMPALRAFKKAPDPILPADESIEPLAQSEPVSRAQREAERAILGLLLAAPELARETIELDVEGERVALLITEALAPERFLDADHAALYRTWRECADLGTFSFAHYLAEVAEPQRKALASDLYLDGERRTAPSSGSPLQALRDSIAEAIYDLERLDRRSRFHLRHDLRNDDLQLVIADQPQRSAPLDLAAAQERMNRLRHRGTDVTAIPRPVRAN